MSIIQLAESFGLNTEGGLDGTTNAAYRALSPARAKALAEASELWGQAWGGSRMASVMVGEALTTSDLFRSATGALLDRELLAQYEGITPTWQEWASPATVRNFNVKKFVDIMGGKSALDRVPELTEFPGAKSGSNEYEIAVEKFGRRFGHSWEANINDDIDELRQIPGAYGSAASITENHAALEQVANLSTGAPSAFFKSYSEAAAKVLGYAAFNNKGTAALSTASLESAITDVNTRRDVKGNLVPNNGLILMVGPALEFDATRILNAEHAEVSDGSGGTMRVPNAVRGKVRLVVNNDLFGVGWFVLPDPRRNRRPAVAVAKLAGFETPDLRVSANTGSRVGGGAIAPTEGDFELDGVWYRCRHVTGGAAMDPIHTFASTGAA